MTLNFIQGLPSLADQRIVTQQDLLKKVGDRKWIKEVAERGSGVTFGEFISMVRKSLAAFRLQEYVVEVIRPTNNTAESLAKVQQALATNEATAVAFEGKPKFGPDAVPISRHGNYLRTAPAPDYWKLSPFYARITTLFWPTSIRGYSRATGTGRIFRRSPPTIRRPGRS